MTRSLARVVMITGAVGIGWFLFAAAPREVVLVYDLAGAPGATSLAVELRRDSEIVRRAEFPIPPGREGPIRHPMRVPDGDYLLVFRVDSAAGPVHGERPLVIHEEGTIVLPLAR